MKRRVITARGCWLYTGAGGVRSGHRKIDVWDDALQRFRKAYAHRIAYEWFVGPIPEGMMIRHRCHRPACFNPEHLTPGTNKDNFEDHQNSGRALRDENGRFIAERSEDDFLLPPF